MACVMGTMCYTLRGGSFWIVSEELSASNLNTSIAICRVVHVGDRSEF